jgi:N-dimethylarginine dimethylaminohydrolase
VAGDPLVAHVLTLWAGSTVAGDLSGSRHLKAWLPGSFLAAMPHLIINAQHMQLPLSTVFHTLMGYAFVHFLIILLVCVVLQV